MKGELLQMPPLISDVEGSAVFYYIFAWILF